MANVSIVCITYNQEKFVAQALDSFVMQKTDFPFEIIIADDCSTDNTAEIVKEYITKYPDIIKPIFREKNLGAIGNYIETLSTIKSEYVIYNEGDDYFTDPLKLQKQVDFLDANPDCTICFHPVEVIYDDNSKPSEIYPNKLESDFITEYDFDNLLRGNFIQTNSCMYRWRFGKNEKIEDIFPRDIMPGDWYLHLLHAQKGNIGLLDEVMSVYRKHSGGIWIGGVETIHLKHGLKEISFFNNVHKNITNNSEKYLESVLNPYTRAIFNTYFINKRFDALDEFAKIHPEIFQYVYDAEKDEKQKLFKHYKKYKKRFEITFYIGIFSFVINIILIGFIIWKNYFML